MTLFLKITRLRRLKAAAQICDEFLALGLLKDLPDDEADKSLLDEIKDMSPGFEDTLVACSLMGEYSTCFKYFHDVMTEDGLCYGFNVLSPNEILTE